MIRPADPPDPLDRWFPLGDGTAETGAGAWCAYCGEQVELVLDPGGGATQRYVEDCPVCCRPWLVTARWDREGRASVELRTEDEP